VTCPEHQLVLHLLLVVELLLQLEKARVFKALLHLTRPGLLLMAMLLPPFRLLLLLQEAVVFWLLAGGAR